MAFQIKSFLSIAASMINRLRATNSVINDYNVGAMGRVLVEAVAQEQDEIYRQLLNAVVEATPVAVFNSFDFALLGAQPASGSYRVTIAPQPTATAIVRGTVFTRSDGNATYTSLSAVTIPTGQNYVDVLVDCTANGPIGNLAAGDLATLSPQPPGFTSAINLVAMQGGVDVETNDSRGQRFREYVSTLTRGIVAALVYGAKQARLLDANGNVVERVVSAVVVEPYLADSNQPPSYVQVYVHNGIGGTSVALVARAKQVLTGYVDPTTGAKVAGYKSAGCVMDVYAATEQPVPITATLLATPGYDHGVLVATATTVIASYVAALGVGQSALKARMVQLVMEIPGVANFVLASPAGDVVAVASAKLVIGAVVIL